MPRFVVLLRGVNVGKGNRVPMADFRRLLEQLGYSHVKTLLNSGNAVFTSASRSTAAHADAIGASLNEHLGISIPVVVKSSAEFQAAVTENPAEPAADQYSRFLVAFAQAPATLSALAALDPLVDTSERFHVGRHAAYLSCPDGILESKAAIAMLGKIGKGVTTRNWATVLKLRALLDEVAAS